MSDDAAVDVEEANVAPAQAQTMEVSNNTENDDMMDVDETHEEGPGDFIEQYE